MAVALVATSAASAITLSGITPDSGPVEGGTKVTLTGQFAVDGNMALTVAAAQAYYNVTFGGVLAAFDDTASPVVTAGQIHVVAPAGTTKQDFSVDVRVEDAQDSNVFDVILDGYTYTVASEGEGEGDACMIDVQSPRTGATYYIPATATALIIEANAKYTCPDATAIRYQLDDTVIGTVAPSARFLVHRMEPPAYGVFSLKGELLADSVVVDDDTNVFTIAQSSSASDGDANGLPDDPFAVLQDDGDVYYETEDGGSGTFRSSALVRWNQPTLVKANDDETVSATVQTRSDGTKQLRVSVKKSLLDPGQSGILVVQYASDLKTLLGNDEARDVDNVPGGGLVSGSGYFAISVIVKSSVTGDFVNLDGTRLLAMPAKITMAGVDAGEAQTALLWAYPATMGKDALGVFIDADRSGEWDNTPVMNQLADGGKVTADVDGLAIYSLTKPRQSISCFGGTLAPAARSIRSLPDSCGDLGMAVAALLILAVASRSTRRRLQPGKAQA